MLLLDKPSQKAPFTLLFSEKLDSSLYAEAIKDSQKLADTYNPETQTSDFSIYAGTSQTVDSTYTGIFMSTDDSEPSDD
ncbi:MAG: hypothetical protein WCP16_16790 [Pseudanabaena sp. ELA645]|jgi:hypothetical protein